MEAQLARRCHAQGEARGDLLVSSDAIHFWISIHTFLPLVDIQGLEDAFGMMVNYRYFPEKTQENNRKYAEEKNIDISDDVLKILNSST